MLSIGTLRLCALTVASALLLAAVPQESLAKNHKPKACRKLRLDAGCVTNKDIKRKSLSAADFEDAEGADFKSKPAKTKDVDHVPREYAKVVLDVPAKGVVIVNASAYIEADDEEFGMVGCHLTEGSSDLVGTGFAGTVNRHRGPSAFSPDTINLKYDTLFLTYGFEVNSKQRLKIGLRCKMGRIITSSRGPLGLGAASLTAQYFATKY